MAPPRKPLNADDIVRRYLAGESISALTRAERVGKERIREILDAAGVERRDAGTAVALSRWGGGVDVSAAEVATLYRSGLPGTEVAQRLGVSVSTVSHLLDEQGVPRRSPAEDAVAKFVRTTGVTAEEVARRYLGGESEKALAEALGVWRSTIRIVLTEQGIAARGRSDALEVRLAQLSVEERKRLASFANTARRGQRASTREMTAKAVARVDNPCWTGLGEAEIAELLSAHSLAVEPQRAEGPYNIDVATWPVAVEVHRHTTHPMRQTRIRERAVYLADQGWRVLYVWCYRSAAGQWCFSDAAAEEVVTHIQRAQADPTSVREYRVVRCTGQDAP
ncbi:helix-turn-helix domain-containing protein [Nonomuraea basaltis]|uniref:helix-turn-helix domain-containing protein n=1 Tax=Nonomuraea basaltis TaxID=2495887 RepID=UPI001F0DBFC8|nr:helix-turn-helix transcriptional regulator [Nonomuraea basaltis]